MSTYELMIRHYIFLVLTRETITLPGCAVAVKVIPFGKSTGSAGSNLIVEEPARRKTISVAPVLSVTVIISAKPDELPITMPAIFRLPVNGVQGGVSDATASKTYACCSAFCIYYLCVGAFFNDSMRYSRLLSRPSTAKIILALSRILANSSLGVRMFIFLGSSTVQ